MLQFQTILEKSLNVKIKFPTSLIGGSYIYKKKKKDISYNFERRRYYKHPYYHLLPCLK